MPGILIARYSANNKKVNALGKDELTARAQKIQLYREYYDGDQYRWFKPDPGALRDDSIVLNLCGRAVDKMSEFIGSPTKIEVPGKADAKTAVMTENGKPITDPAQEDVDAIWDEHQADVPEIILSGLLSGHNFIKLHIEDDEACMTLLDPLTTQAFWNETNPKKVLFYRLMWKSGDTNFMQDIVPNWLAEAPADAEVLFSTPVANYWWILDYKQGNGDDWIRIREEKWPYEFAPIVDWPMKKQPHEFYGRSMLHRAIGKQDAVNFIASNTGRILKHHAHPLTLLFGASVSEKEEPNAEGLIPVAANPVGGIIDDLPEEARAQTVEMQSDLASSMNFLNLLRGEFFSDVRVVDTATVQDKLGQITNFGVRMLFSDQIEATEETTTLAGKGLAEVTRRMLAINGTLIEDKLSAVWADPLPVDKLELATAVEKEAKVGVLSDETLIEELGKDPDTEKANKKKEAEDAVDSQVRVLEKMGNMGAVPGARGAVAAPQQPAALPPGQQQNPQNGNNPQ